MAFWCFGKFIIYYFCALLLVFFLHLHAAVPILASRWSFEISTPVPFTQPNVSCLPFISRDMFIGKAGGSIENLRYFVTIDIFYRTAERRF